MLKIPPKSDFGGSTDIPAKVTLTDWMNNMKNNGCIGCHQLGQLSTRTLPEGHRQAFVARSRPGCAACRPASPASRWSRCWPASSAACRSSTSADWTDRVAKGELPHTKPTRPQGEERNIVVTTWDWGTEKHYLHDLIASDRRFPTVNAYGPLFGSPEYSTDAWPILDPKTHTVTYFNAPVARPRRPAWRSARATRRATARSRRRPIGAPS